MVLEVSYNLGSLEPSIYDDRCVSLDKRIFWKLFIDRIAFRQ